jgi:hypothetical protein
VEVQRNAFGAKYNLEFDLSTDKGFARIQSGWIILNDEDFPRLVTCYII